MKTIQINLGGMKAAELRGSRIKKPKCNKDPDSIFSIRPLSGTAMKKKTSNQ